ncbi:unnamed protein product [Prorocentrum cordatum]|uniref:Ammonium transporter AmtB-like domain-containing protein n=1 Tax=Prorocentrum cordatum TaxID=2364126 RepID=A0ABN9USD4_9DINO|nr:unnamed protein product [Polarella glacialis]
MNGTAPAVVGAGASDPFAVAWVLICAFFVISMQLGFALLEVGSVRDAHRQTVLAKNIMDSCASAVAFWIFSEVAEPSIVRRGGVTQPHLLLWHWAFCAASVTICSGAMAERTHMTAYLTFAACMAGVVYPIVANSAWGDGLLSQEFHGRWHQGYDYHDFSGSGVVHALGGTSALVGNLMLGRRIMRPENGGLLPGLEQRELRKQQQRQKNPSGSPPRPHGRSREDRKRGAGTRARTEPGHLAPKRGDGVDVELAGLAEQDLEETDLLRPAGGWPRRFEDAGRDEVEFRAITHMQVNGMFALWIGWYGFNAGSTLTMDKQAALAAGLIAWNTTVAGASGGFGAYLYCCIFRKHLDLAYMSNGVLTGLVTVTASCDVATPGSAAAVGFLGGMAVFPLASRCMKAMHLDDPVDAISLHLGGGLFGLLATALCRPDCEMLSRSGGGQASQTRFCLEGHDAGKQMVAQLWGALVLVAFCGASFALIWGFFAVSERTRALEVEHLVEAEQLLHRMVTPEEPHENAEAQWERIVGRSPLARRILHRHGLARGCFPQGVPDDVWRLRRELRQARGEKAETALEKHGLAACLARAAHQCWPLRELAVLRLRISPAAELSGLGSAELDGGRMFGTLRALVAQVAAVREAENYAHSPLKREVRDLTHQVRSQEAILAGLIRGGRLGNWRKRRLQSVPERSGEGPGGGSWEPTAERQGGYQQAALADRELPPVEGPSAGAGADRPPSSHSSDLREPPAYDQFAPALIGRTHSESSQSTDQTQRGSAISFNSASDATPPPSGLGIQRSSRSQRRHGASSPRAQDAVTQELLMSVLQAQTHLLSALGSAAHSGISTPQAGLVPHRAAAAPPYNIRPALDNRRLIEALQAASLDERLSSASQSTASLSERTPPARR